MILSFPFSDRCFFTPVLSSCPALATLQNAKRTLRSCHGRKNTSCRARAHRDGTSPAPVPTARDAGRKPRAAGASTRGRRACDRPMSPFLRGRDHSAQKDSKRTARKPDRARRMAKWAPLRDPAACGKQIRLEDRRWGRRRSPGFSARVAGARRQERAGKCGCRFGVSRRTTTPASSNWPLRHAPGRCFANEATLERCVWPIGCWQAGIVATMPACVGYYGPSAADNVCAGKRGRAPRPAIHDARRVQWRDVAVQAQYVSRPP